jgi:transcriptional regulator with XRE-family HTH domain
MTKHEFKKRLKALGLTTSAAATQFRVSRYAVMHWKAGRRPVPGTIAMMLELLEGKRQQEFLE